MFVVIYTHLYAMCYRLLQLYRAIFPVIILGKVKKNVLLHTLIMGVGDDFSCSFSVVGLISQIISVLLLKELYLINNIEEAIPYNRIPLALVPLGMGTVTARSSLVCVHV